MHSLTIRSADEADVQQLTNLIHFETQVHRHLDWMHPIAWVGQHPFVIAEYHGIVTAALACPPDPPNIAWIRMFAVSAGVSTHSVWRPLWEKAETQLRELVNPVTVAVIPLQKWFQNLMTNTEFEHTHDVIVLTRKGGELSSPGQHPDIQIREMTEADLDQVEEVDSSAFVSLWRISNTGLKTAFEHAAIATVAEVSNELVAYQISTSGSVGGHLARLAVKPDFQGLRIASNLLYDLLAKFAIRGITNISVNTQHNNPASIGLYDKFGFIQTGEVYPVYEFSIGG